jgi:hypothetical protein
MAIGDKQAIVQECVDGILRSHRIPEPIDRTRSLADYHYTRQNMPPFHIQVADCLRGKHYKYTYDPTDAYMAQTVGLPLLQLYSAISTRTTAAVLASLEMAEHLDLPEIIAAEPAAPSARKKKKAAAKKAAAAKKPAKKAAKKATRKTAAKKTAKKRRAAKRGGR